MMTDAEHLEREQRAIVALTATLKPLCERIAADTGLESGEVAQIAQELLDGSLDEADAHTPLAEPPFSS